MLRNLISIVILFFAALIISTAMRNALAGEKRIIGWLEKVRLPEYGFVLKAKIDTGAKNSSIHAFDIEYLQTEGKPSGSRIRFKSADHQGRYRSIEADVLRQARVKTSSVETETRPEIEMEICLAGIRKRIRVNLTDRAEMNYRMILGRTALEGDFVVDVSQKYTAESSCGND